MDPLADPDRRLVRSTAFSANASMGAVVGLSSAAAACMTAAPRYAAQRVTVGRPAPGIGVLVHGSQQSAPYSAPARTYAAGFLVEHAKFRGHEAAQIRGPPLRADPPEAAFAPGRRTLPATK